jgi:hypothetical protein
MSKDNQLLAESQQGTGGVRKLNAVGCPLFLLRVSI